MEEGILEKTKVYFLQTGEKYSDEFLLLLIESLVDEYKKRRNYPYYFDDQQISEDIERYFQNKQSYFAAKVIPAMVGKIGAEGQSSHSENGISRVWEADQWFNDVIPYCEVV